MRHVRMLGICLVAVLAVAAVATTSAMALPEWGKCAAKAGGKYSDANCTVKAHPSGSGSYEWLKASQVASKRVSEGKSANVPFSGESAGGGGVLTAGARQCEVGAEPQVRRTRQSCEEAGGVETEHAAEPNKVECAIEHATGETVAKNKVANIHVVFKGCALFGALPCKSEGKEEGEIETSTLKGELGYINKSAKEVGVLLEPAKKHGLFASFECSGIGVDVGAGNNKEGAEYTSAGCYGTCPGTTPEEEKNGGYDGIISPITPVNEMTSKYTQVYTQESEYPWRNIPNSFEKKHVDVLEVGQDIGVSEVDWSPAGEEITNVNTSEEAGEIKA